MVARTIYGQLLLQRQDGHPPTLSGESIDTQNCDMQFFLEKHKYTYSKVGKNNLVLNNEKEKSCFSQGEPYQNSAF